MNKQDWKIFKKSFKEDWFLWLLQSIIIILIFGTLGFCIYSRFTELSPERYNIFSVVYEWTFHKYFIVIICYNSIIYSILKHTKIDL